MAFAQEDWIGSLKVTSLTNGCININTNTGTQAFDTTGYTGKLAVFLSCGAGVSGTVIVPSIKAGADLNVLNANNWVVNATNFSTTVSNQVIESALSQAKKILAKSIAKPREEDGGYVATTLNLLGVAAAMNPSLNQNQTKELSIAMRGDGIRIGIGRYGVIWIKK